jgi:hypothetical protein
MFKLFQTMNGGLYNALTSDHHHCIYKCYPIAVIFFLSKNRKNIVNPISSALKKSDDKESIFFDL